MTNNEVEWRNLIRLMGQIVTASILFGVAIGRTIGRHRG